MDLELDKHQDVCVAWLSWIQADVQGKGQASHTDEPLEYIWCCLHAGMRGIIDKVVDFFAISDFKADSSQLKDFQ